SNFRAKERPGVGELIFLPPPAGMTKPPVVLISASSRSRAEDRHYKIDVNRTSRGDSFSDRAGVVTTQIIRDHAIAKYECWSPTALTEGVVGAAIRRCTLRVRRTVRLPRQTSTRQI